MNSFPFCSTIKLFQSLMANHRKIKAQKACPCSLISIDRFHSENFGYYPQPWPEKAHQAETSTISCVWGHHLY